MSENQTPESQENPEETTTAKREAPTDQQASRLGCGTFIVGIIAIGAAVVFLLHACTSLVAGNDEDAPTTPDSSGVSSAADDGPENLSCAEKIHTRSAASEIVKWSNSMRFPLEHGGFSYQGDVDLADGTHRSYLCDVDSDGEVIRAGWLSDFD